MKIAGVRVKVSPQFCVRASTVQLTWRGLYGIYPPNDT